MAKVDAALSFITTNKIGEVICDYEIKNLTTAKTGGTVHFVLYPDSFENLFIIINYFNKNHLNFKVIGNGSNLLFPDFKMDLIIVKLDNCHNELKVDGDLFTVGASFSLRRLARSASKLGMSGLEFSGGIPATVGGAIFMNAGAHTQEMKDIVRSVLVYDSNAQKIITLTNNDCKFTYRSSAFKDHPEYTILEVILKLEKGNEAVIYKRMMGNLEYRKLKQPLS